MKRVRSAGGILGAVIAVTALVHVMTRTPTPPAAPSLVERSDAPAIDMILAKVRAEPIVNLTAVEHSATVVDPLELRNAVPLEVPRLPEEELPKAAATPAPPAESPAPAPPPETPAPAATTSPVDDGPLISPVLLRAAWVPYPVSAKKRKVEGQVEVRVRVEEDGTVSSVELVTSSPDTSLNRAARESAMTMRFRPASQGGRPVSVWYNYRFDFRLPPS